MAGKKSQSQYPWLVRNGDVRCICVPNSSVSAFFCIYMYLHICWIGLMYQNLTGWLWLQRRLLDSIAVLSISILGWLCLAGWMDGYGCTVGLIQLASDGSLRQ
jgi:hypothetical protein